MSSNPVLKSGRRGNSVWSSAWVVEANLDQLSTRLRAMKTFPTEKKLKQRQYFASASLFWIGAKQNRNKFPKKVPLVFFLFKNSCYVLSCCVCLSCSHSYLAKFDWKMSKISSACVAVLPFNEWYRGLSLLCIPVVVMGWFNKTLTISTPTRAFQVIQSKYGWLLAIKVTRGLD